MLSLIYSRKMVISLAAAGFLACRTPAPGRPVLAAPVGVAAAGPPAVQPARDLPVSVAGRQMVFGPPAAVPTALVPHGSPWRTPTVSTPAVVEENDSEPSAGPQVTTAVAAPPSAKDGPQFFERGFNDKNWGWSSGRIRAQPSSSPVLPGAAASTSTLVKPALLPVTRDIPSTFTPVGRYRRVFTWDAATMPGAAVLRILRGDGAVFYLNGREVARDPKLFPTLRPLSSSGPSPRPVVRSSGTVVPRPTSTARPLLPLHPLSDHVLNGVPDQGGPNLPFSTQICLSAHSLVAGENLLAVEVFRRTGDVNEISFDLDLVMQTEPVLLRGPYLQMGTSGSLVVRWRTDCPAPSRIALGDVPGTVDRLVSDDRMVTDHEVQVQGLAAAHLYHYAVGQPRAGDAGIRWLAGGDTDTFFVTTPDKPHPTRIWVLGDSGTKGAGAAAVREAYTRQAAGRTTDVWLMLGDNAYDRGFDYEHQGAVFDMYPRYLRQNVLWPAVGNHETSQLHEISQVSRSPYFDIFTLPTRGEAGGLGSGTERYYAFDHGDIHFVCLDSMTTSMEATALSRRYPEAMLTWLDQDLAANRRPFVVAFFHHPPYTKGTHDSDSSGDYESHLVRKQILPILEKFGTDLVLSGHSHVYERSFLMGGHYDVSSTFNPAMKKDGSSGRADEGHAYKKTLGAANSGTVYMVAGSSGQTTSRVKLNHPAMFISMPRLGSVVIDVDQGSLTSQFLRDDGVIADHFTIQKSAP